MRGALISSVDDPKVFAPFLTEPSHLSHLRCQTQGAQPLVAGAASLYFKDFQVGSGLFDRY
jgi:hypothetical protein